MRGALCLLLAAVATLCAGCGGAAGDPHPTRGRHGASVRVQARLASTNANAGATRGSFRPTSALITHGPRDRRDVALTFDADMNPYMLAALRSGRQRTWYDRAIVEELERTHTPATVFLTGMWARTYPSVVRRLARNPLFELENHSWDHASWERPCYGLPSVPGVAAKRREVTLTARIVERLTGRRPRYFRYPGGCATAADFRLVARLGEQPLDWDVVSGDAFNPNAASIVRAVLAGVRPGSIVIMHFIGAPNAPATAQALPAIIRGLRARGYRFVTVARLLAHDARRIRAARRARRRSRHAPASHTAAAPPLAGTGRIRIVYFHSRALGRRDRFAVWLPPGYDPRGPQRYPVVYLLHPPRGSPLDYFGAGRAAVAASALIGAHRIRPLLIVVPYGLTRGFADDTEWADAEAGRYGSYVLDVVRAVDRRFRTYADRRHRALAGLSEGGYGAVNLALQHLGAFSVAESWSGYFVQTPTTTFHAAPPRLLAENSPALYVSRMSAAVRSAGLRAFLYDGEHDQVHAEVLEAFAPELARAGADVEWGFFRGGHDWGLWRRELPRSLILADRWFAEPPSRSPRGRLLRLGGPPAPWNSYYHYRGPNQRAH